MRFRLLLIAFFSCFLIITGCKKDVEQEELNNDSEKFLIDVNDSRNWIEVGPGKYSGHNFYEDKVKELILNWPEELSSDQYFARLMALTAEDYRKFQKKLNETDIVFSDITERPDGGIGLIAENLPTLYVQILLDASGSMAGLIDGKTKMDLAKEAINDFVTDLPENTEVSLRVYGHKGSGQKKDKRKSCATTEIVYDMSTYDEKSFTEALNKFEPTGYTPIAKAIEDAKKDLLKEVKDENAKSVIYVVSDGKETCDGDPVQAAKEIQETDIEAVVNIIGFDIGASEREALEAIAVAGNGKYHHANTGDELWNAFREENYKIMEQWYEWGSENVVQFFDEESTYVDESYQYETAGIQLSEEEEKIQLELTKYIEKEREDIDTEKLRTLISTRSIGIRSYLRDQYYAIRNEARNAGYELRDQVRKEADEIIEELRAKTRKK